MRRTRFWERRVARWSCQRRLPMAIIPAREVALSRANLEAYLALRPLADGQASTVQGS